MLERDYKLNDNSLLGKGTTFKMIPISDGSSFAVKIMKPMDESDQQIRCPTLLGSFRNEVNINIIGLIDHFIYDSIHSYLIIELANVNF